MKITNLILNLLNGILLYLWGFMPFIIGFFGSLIQVLFTSKSDSTLVLAGVSGLFSMIMATATIPLSIIAFKKIRRGSKKPYIIIESILICLSTILFILAIPSIYGFNSFENFHESDWNYLIAFPIIGLISNSIITVFTILIGVLKGRPVQNPAVTAPQYGQPYQEFVQPYLRAGQQPQQPPQT